MRENFIRQKEREEQEALKYLSALHEVFAKSPAGKELLQYWIDNYIFAPVLPPVDQPGKYTDDYAAKRDGENGFIRAILVGIKRYEAYLNKPK